MEEAIQTGFFKNLEQSLMISLIIPAIDKHEFTQRAVEYAKANAVENIEIIIIDNNSQVPYSLEEYNVDKIIREEKNLGVPKSILRSSEVASGDIIVFIHNDVYIHEYGWDQRISNAFQNDNNLAISGFFGATGVSPDGGRHHSMSNMLGIVGGTGAEIHGSIMQDIAPVSTLDGLCIIFRKDIIKNLELEKLPPHHWYDRIIPLQAIKMGYNVNILENNGQKNYLLL